MAKTGKVVCGGTIERIGGVTGTPLFAQDSPGFSCVPGDPSVLGRLVGGLGGGRV